VTFYKRHLPHWHPKGAAIFLTWHLAGSLPKDIRKATATLAASTSDLSAGERFVILDREMDRAEVGPTWLRDSRVARCVVETLIRGASVLGHYQLHAYVVMANHVHLLITPAVPVGRIMNGIKGSSACKCNRILCLSDKHFWQHESYDHWARDAVECQRICRYIENNPVAAGLVERAEDWAWSSASAEGKAHVTHSQAA
jgi:putative transposase